MVELSNGTLANLRGFLAADPDLTITVNRSDLELVMAAQARFEDLVQDGRAVLEGDGRLLGQLQSLFVTFTPDVEILPGSRLGGSDAAPQPEPFQQSRPASSAGG